MSRIFKSGALAAVHETAADLCDAGQVDKLTMRKFDRLCLTPATPLSAAEIREIRVANRVSQTVFAHYLNVSPGVVSQWECGEKRPAGAALKLLAIVRSKGLEAIA